MKTRGLIIHINVRSNAPIKRIQEYYKWNVQLDFYNVEVQKITIQPANKKERATK